jgi:hypothetical protein
VRTAIRDLCASFGISYGRDRHAQMYTMGTVLRHGTPEQKQRYLRIPRSY